MDLDFQDCLGRDKPVIKVIKLLSFSTQLSTKFILIINVKMSPIVGTLTFISRINASSEIYTARKNLYISSFGLLGAVDI